MRKLPSISIGAILQFAVVGLHGAVVLAALLVPCYAIGGAVTGLIGPTEGESLAELVDVGRWLALLGNTALVCGVAVLIATAFGVVFGVLASRTDLPGRSLIIVAALVGACIPVYVYIIIFFSLISVSTFSKSAIACGVFYGLIFTPLAILLLATLTRSADRELEEQALLDANPRTVFLRVTLPHLRWGVAVLGMIVVMLVATDHTIADILMVRTFAEEIYTQYALRRLRVGPVITSLPILAVVAAMLVLVQVRCRLVGENSPWQFGTLPRTFPLGRFRSVVAAGCALIAFLALGIPTVALARKVGTIEDFFVALRSLWGELLLSGVLGASGATIVVASAIGLAWAALRSRRLRWPLGVAIVLLLSLPAPLVGISLIELLNRPGLLGRIYDSPIAITIGYLIRFLPVGVLLMLPAVQRVPSELESAARIDGCDWLGTQRHVYWPAVARVVPVVWLIVLVLCFAEVGATVLLAPPGYSTASVRAFTLIHFGVYRDLAVLAAASVGCVLLPSFLLARLLRTKTASAAVN